MFKVLIADDDFEDRELLKLEIQRALKDEEPDLRFHEASGVREALKVLTTQLIEERARMALKSGDAPFARRTRPLLQPAEDPGRRDLRGTGFAGRTNRRTALVPQGK